MTRRPSVAPGISPAGDPCRLRQVLAHVPTPVTVVCALDGQDPVGHTVGSFVSVSLDPPLVGYFAMRSSLTLGAVRSSGAFSVNVLAGHQVELGRRFAQRSGERFEGVRWEPGAAGCPHLHGAIAVFDCEIDRVLTVGDHELVVGRVTAATGRTGAAAPLVFAGGRFHALAGTAPGRSLGQNSDVAEASVLRIPAPDHPRAHDATTRRLA